MTRNSSMIFLVLLVFSMNLSVFAQSEKEHYLNGNEYFKAGKYTEAVSEYKKSVEINPDFADAWYNMALAKTELKDFQGAIQAYDKTIQLSPSSADAYNNRGNLKFVMNNNKGAAEDFDVAIELKPDFTLAYFNRGNVFYKTRNFRTAIEDFTKVIRLDPSFAIAWYLRANSYRELEIYEEALPDYNMAISIKEEPAMYAGRGLCKYYLEDINGSIMDFEKAIELDNNYADAYYLGALVKIEAGLTESACNDLKKAAELGIEKAQNFIDEYCK